MRMSVVLACLGVLAMPSVAGAFCGFYVAGGDQPLVNDATQVVLMRKGTRTVLSMQNSYKGPPEAFAMIVPVPVVLHEQDVKTLTKDVFAHVEMMGAPRLVEYWEQDPCAPPIDYEVLPAPTAMGSRGGSESDKADDTLGVKVEAKFTVGEYQIVILSAKDSTGLDTWLRQEKYNIPAGAEPLLRPYVEGGMKFFVAKVDPKKVVWNGEKAVLSPLRFHYDAEEFSLPVRLGIANSSGTQDLIVNILAPHQRFEMANYPNVTIPTNIDVKPSVKNSFGAFYAALFDATVEKHEGAVVTEYAWQATTCDPCPGPALDASDFETLGADVLLGSRDKPQRYDNADFVLTRLHARYGKDLQNDLVFKQATPIAGGREHVQTGGTLEEGAVASSTNNFQGRYAIRYPWMGPIRCNNPVRGNWGGPPPEVQAQPGFQATGTKAALDLAAAPRDAIQLTSVIARDVPEIGLRAGAAAPDPTPAGAQTPAGSAGSAAAPPAAAKKKTGCGCGTTGDASPWLGVGLAALLLRRKRRAA
jgi:MYXO-CTERM domain-containing protein